MKRLYHRFNRILRRVLRRSPASVEAAIHNLPPETLSRALAEARFLTLHHGVEVRTLLPDELPGVPTRADGNAASD